VSTGRLCGIGKQNIQMWNPKPEFYEQSSNDIWQAVCTSVRRSMEIAGVGQDDICGIAFDATCSLVSLDGEDSPVGVDPVAPNDAERNIIVWLDHRANEQAATINALGHARLRTVGGVISPEMEVPKMLWLKQKMPEAFARVSAGGKFLDLADFLSYRATDYANATRSLCTVVCKWNYDARPSGDGVGWDGDFFEKVGFGRNELQPQTIGELILPPGERIVGGIGAVAAAELGLRAGLPLAVGMIDAHAGGVGSLGARLPSEADDKAFASDEDLESRLAIICGTSTCHMASSCADVFVAGVWGPYYSAMFDGLFLTEGGQSAAGKLLDFLIETHAAFQELQERARQLGVPPSAALNAHLASLASAASVPLPLLAAKVHLTPDFAGNRSPLGDPQMRGAIVGLSLSSTMDDLAILYLAATQALAYQTRHIVEALDEAGHAPISALIACGGLTKNPLYMQMHADALQRPIYLPAEEEAVLLGAAVLAATAGGAHGSVRAAMAAMTSVGAETLPDDDGRVRDMHERKYRVFRKMVDDQLEYRRIMGDAPMS